MPAHPGRITLAGFDKPRHGVVPQAYQGNKNLAAHLLIGTTERIEQSWYGFWIAYTSQSFDGLHFNTGDGVLQCLNEFRGGSWTAENTQDMRCCFTNGGPLIIHSSQQNTF